MTDDANRLREQLESATGERVSALEGIGEASLDEPATHVEKAKPPREPERDRHLGTGADAVERVPPAGDREPAEPLERKQVGMDLEI